MAPDPVKGAPSQLECWQNGPILAVHQDDRQKQQPMKKDEGCPEGDIRTGAQARYGHSAERTTDGPEQRRTSRRARAVRANQGVGDAFDDVHLYRVRS